MSRASKASPARTSDEVAYPDQASASQLGLTIARAFHPLPASQYLVPDPQRREQVYPAYFELAVLDTLEHGTPYAIGTDAVALWMAVGADGLPPVEFDAQLANVDQDLAERDLIFHQTLHEHHPFERGAHHWLMILGASPERQGRGLGSRLLDFHHAYLDQQGLGSYLEAASQRARELYRRHGYADLEEQIVLPNQSVMYPMWRDPRPQ